MTAFLHRSVSSGGTGRESVLDDVLEDVANRLQAGEPVDYEAILATYPEHAESLLRLLPAVEVMAEFGVSASRLAARGVPTRVGPLETGLGELGDFRILREIGRGGMGVVYEAEQISLGRRVALKVLPFAAALDSHQLQRFKTEAQAAAQLHHTHIVPVYCVGCERGVHYYAMEYIEGQTLAQAIAERRKIEVLQHASTHSPPRGEGARRAGEAAADTHAPDARRVPDGQVRDFGDSPTETADPRPPARGASFQSPPTPKPTASAPSSRSREYCRTAAALGIQAAEALDHAHKVGIVHRDIKPANLLLDVGGSLWITDFGLARLQDDAGLTITGDLLGTLRYMSPEQALAKRGYLDHRTDIYALGATLYELVTLRPAVDGQDRQEVLRKIAQDDPASPRKLNPAVPIELETILLKAMSKEPASRYGTAQELAEDLRRFLDDKPTRARRPTLLERMAKWARRHRMVVAVGVFVLLFASVTLATSTVLIARKEREVEKQRDGARQAVDDMYTEVAQDWLAQQASLQPMQQKFLQKALNYYQQFAGEASTDAKLRLKTAVAHRRVGEIQDKLGHYSEAESACRQAAGILERLLADAPTVRQYQHELATTESTLASLLWATGPQNQAKALTRHSIARMEKLAADAPSETQYRHDLANSQMLLARFLWKSDPGEAVMALHRAIALLEKLAADAPSNPRYRSSLIGAYVTLGLALRDIGRHAEARRSYRRAIALSEELVFETPSVPEYMLLLAQSLNNFAELGGSTLDEAESEQLYRRAIELEEKLVDGSPAVPSYRELLAMTHDSLGQHLTDRRPKEAERVLRWSIVLFEKLAIGSPSAIQFQSRLAGCHNDLGFLLARTGRGAEAEQEFRSVISLGNKLATDIVSAPQFQRELGIGILNLAKLLRLAGRPIEAEQTARRAVAILEKLSDYPSLGHLSWFLATGPFPQLRDPQAAIRLAKQALEQRPQNADFVAILGMAHYRAGEWKAAIESLEKSLQLPSRGDPCYWLLLAMAFWQNGEKQKARSSYGEAVQRMEKIRSQDEDEVRRFRAEAASLLGVTEHPKSTERKEENATHPSKP